MENQNYIYKKIGEHILEKKESLSQRMNGFQTQNPRFEDNKKSRMDLNEEFFSMLGEGMIHHPPTSAEPKDQMGKWGRKASEYCLKHNVSLEAALSVLPQYRDVLVEVIEKKCTEDQLSLHESFVVYRNIESLMDKATHIFSHIFLEHHISALEDAKTEMQEISVPVVPIKQGTAVLPLIGNMDDERSEFLQKRTLERATELELSYLIIDLSGLNTINTWFAQHLFQVIDALQLLGIDTSISGMRPELSQTIVHLGITFKHVDKFLTLEQALHQHTVYS